MACHLAGSANASGSGMGNGNSTRNFYKHKQRLKKEKLPDKAYQNYVINTDWYEEYLKDPRDDLIVHPYPLIWTDAASGKILVSVTKIAADRKVLVKQLQKLRQEYMGTIPTLQMKIENYEILDIFLQYKESLKEKDRQRIDLIFKHWGRMLPSINEASEHIFKFITFISNHFKKPTSKP